MSLIRTGLGVQGWAVKATEEQREPWITAKGKSGRMICTTEVVVALTWKAHVDFLFLITKLGAVEREIEDNSLLLPCCNCR